MTPEGVWPMPQNARPGVGVAWWAGGGAYALASSEAVRLNFRGIRLMSQGPTRLRELSAVPGWARVACNQSAHALCCSDLGCVLPAGAPRVSGAALGLPAELLQRQPCANAKGKELVAQAVYDLSACDLLDEGLDVVYSRGDAYLRHTALPLWRYWLCVGLAVVLVRGLSYNLRGLWRQPPEQNQEPSVDPPPPKQWHALAAALGLLALVVPFDDWDAVYATRADQTFFWATVGYVGTSLLLHATRQVEGGNTPVFNVIVAALQLLAMRLYTAAETPYDVVFVGMLAWRVWGKLLSPALHGASLVLDSLYLALCVELACDEPLESLVAAVGGVPFAAARLV